MQKYKLLNIALIFFLLYLSSYTQFQYKTKGVLSYAFSHFNFFVCNEKVFDKYYKNLFDSANFKIRGANTPYSPHICANA